MLSTLSTAQAQTKHAVANLGGVAGAADLPRDNDYQRIDEPRPARARKMSWASIGVKLGASGMGVGKLSVEGHDLRTDSRLGLHLAVPINLGGDGFGWVFEPYLSQASIGHSTKDGAGNVVGSENVNLNAVGLYLGPTINFRASEGLYLGFGFGLKGAYIMNPAFDYAADLYARVPVTATYYVSPKLALVAEVGFGYGASAFADKPSVQVDPITRQARNVKDDPLVGTAYTWDASFGVRLP